MRVVEAELERNPLLERITEGDTSGSDPQPEVRETRGEEMARGGLDGEPPPASDWTGNDNEQSRAAMETRLDTDLADFLDAMRVEADARGARCKGLVRF